jgi:hypothetical protein
MVARIPDPMGPVMRDGGGNSRLPLHDGLWLSVRARLPDSRKRSGQPCK